MKRISAQLLTHRPQMHGPACTATTTAAILTAARRSGATTTTTTSNNNDERNSGANASSSSESFQDMMMMGDDTTVSGAVGTSSNSNGRAMGNPSSSSAATANASSSASSAYAARKQEAAQTRRVREATDPLHDVTRRSASSPRRSGSSSGGNSKIRRINTSGNKPSIPSFKRALERHNREESARFVKREQYTRIYEFLKGLRKSTTAADNWQVAVTALKDAAGRGTPITSDLVAEAIESCYAAKQYQTASELFYAFHFDFNLARGAKASMAFLRVCAVTGQYDAAKRVVEWIGNADDINSMRHSGSSSANLLAAGQKNEEDGHPIANNNEEGGEEEEEGVERLWMNKKDAAAEDTTTSSSFTLTAEMLTLFLRSAVTSANKESELYHYKVYADALETYQRLRCSARNAPHVVTNPLLVEALVLLHCKANAHEAAYELLLKTVRLLAVDSGKSSSGGSSSNILDEDGSTDGLRFATGKAASRLRRLVQFGDDDEVADGAAKDATKAFKMAYGDVEGSALEDVDRPITDHDDLVSDGSFRGQMSMKASTLDGIMAKLGVRSPLAPEEGGDNNDAADAAILREVGIDGGGGDGGEGVVVRKKKGLQPISIDEKGSMDELYNKASASNTKEADAADANDAARRAVKDRLRQQLAKMAETVREYSELPASSGKDLVVAGTTKVTSGGRGGNTSNSGSATSYTPYVGQLPSNITYITQTTFDAIIRVCFKNKDFLSTFKTVQLAISLGPAASSNYAPDEAAARMLLFAIEEVTATTYDLIGGNIPSLQMTDEYLRYCAKERARIRAELVEERTAARDAKHATGTAPSSSRHRLPPVKKVSEVELLMALPDEIVSSAADLRTRLNAWRLSQQLFNGLAENGYPLFPQTYESPFRTFIAAGRVEEAANQIEEMRKDERVVPQYCYQRLLCERVAHEPVSQQAERTFESLKALADVRENPAYYSALLRHSLNVDNRRLFASISREMLNHEVVEDKAKLLLTVRQRLDADNKIGALAAFSRLSNMLTHEAKRTIGETDYRVYMDDFRIPQPLLQRLLDCANNYVKDQTVRRERILMLGGGGGGSRRNSNEDDDIMNNGMGSNSPYSAGNNHNRKESGGSSLQKHYDDEYWSDERQRNLETAEVIREDLIAKVAGGIKGQYLGGEQMLRAAAVSSKAAAKTIGGEKRAVAPRLAESKPSVTSSSGAPRPPRRSSGWGRAADATSDEGSEGNTNADKRKKSAPRSLKVDKPVVMSF